MFANLTHTLAGTIWTAAGKRGCSRAQANVASLKSKGALFRSSEPETSTVYRVPRSNAYALYDELRALFFMQFCFQSAYVYRSRTIVSSVAQKTHVPKVQQLGSNAQALKYAKYISQSHILSNAP
jgi:hypothetical protein